MTYPSNHIAIPISHSAHNAPTIRVIGRAFSIRFSRASIRLPDAARSRASQSLPAGPHLSFPEQLTREEFAGVVADSETRAQMPVSYSVTR